MAYAQEFGQPPLGQQPLVVAPEVVVVHPVGQSICQEQQMFPPARKFRDVPFALLFLVCILAVGFVASSTKVDVQGVDLGYLPAAWGIGLGVGTLAAVAFVLFLRMMPKQMVWFCLLATPVTLLLLAMYCFSQSSDQELSHDQQESMQTTGIALGILAAIKLMIVFCWRRCIPLTSAILGAVAHVLLHKLQMILIGFLAGGLHVMWLGAAILVTPALSQADEDSRAGLFLVTLFVITWGMVVIRNIAYLSYCGVFTRWYFGQTVTSLGSFVVSCTTSFGSICFGSLIVAFVRILRYIAESAERSNNAVVKILGCVMACMLACIQDMVEWFNSFAYVQVAMRGCSFCDAARATVHLCTLANVKKICSSILAGSVTFMGCFLAGAAGSLAAMMYVNHQLTSKDPDDLEGRDAYHFVFGIAGAWVFGFFASGNVMSIVEAGVNSILVCWAEAPDQLSTTHPDVHAKLLSTSGRDLSVAPGYDPRQMQPNLA